MMFTVGTQLWRMLRHDRANPRALIEIRNRKLQRLVRHAYDTVPYYRKMLDDAGVDAQSIRTVEDLSRMPSSRKADLQAAGIDAITSDAFSAGDLITEKTSGSSGRPFEMRLDRRWVAVRNAMFLRALMATGYRPGRRALLVTGESRRARRWPLPWSYTSFEKSPSELCDEINRVRPWLIYGWVTPLRRLAEHLRETGHSIHAPQAIVTTAEALDTPTRKLLTETLGGAVYQIYGLTEMGAMAWECSQHHGLHLAEDVVIAEYTPAPGAPAPGASETSGGQLLLTNLELRGMPLLRYDCGDLAMPMDATSKPCACGRSLERIQSVEGREVDCVRLPDGRVLSPYQLTLAMEQIAGLERYQIIQVAKDRIEVGYVLPAGRSDAKKSADQICNILGLMFGSGVFIEPKQCATLDPPAGRKFRVVECRL